MDTVESLLERLCSGDPASAEQVFLEYEPYLRMVVRRMLPDELRAKFDSVDVVQSMWADVLVGFRDAGWRFADADHLRAFLVKAAKNRFFDRMRQQQFRMSHEQRRDGLDQDHSADTPQPVDSAQADELWDRMLSLCPPEHHQLLQLKREGHTLEEISVATGYHASSIRRIFYKLAQDLAFTPPGDESAPK